MELYKRSCREKCSCVQSPVWICVVLSVTSPSVQLQGIWNTVCELFSHPVVKLLRLDSDVAADFVLRARGDSMINARIYDGDIVFIKSQPDVENGQIAAVVIDDEATLKRVYKQNSFITLQSENPAYPPLVISSSSGKNVKIIGRAVAFQGVVR